MQGYKKFFTLISILVLFSSFSISQAHEGEEHEDVKFGPFPISYFEDFANQYNEQLVNNTGEQGDKVRGMLESFPSSVFPISVGAELNDTNETLLIKIQKDLLINVSVDNHDADLNLVMREQEFLEVLNSTQTQHPIQAINNSNILFQPKDVKAKLAVDVLRQQLGLNIKVDSKYESSGIVRFVSNLINRILSFFTK